MKTKNLLPLAIALGTTASLQAAAVIHESFSQDTSGGTSLNGKAGETGLSGNWSASTGGSGVTIETAATLLYGDLQNTGGQANVPSAGATNASITTTTVLDDNNLLDDGATLWFSTMFYKTSNGGSNEKGAFALGSGAVTSAFNGQNMTGDGLGFRIQNTTLTAASWTGTGNASDGGSKAISLSTSVLVVGKIEWGVGAGNEQITLYTVDPSDLGTLGTGATRTVAGFTQSAMNTISFTQRNSGGLQVYDEIRFGATQADVLPAVPEPSTTALLGLAGLALILRRRK